MTRQRCYARVQMDVNRRSIIRFGLFELDSRTGELRKRGIKVGLGMQAAEVLRTLLEAGGELVTREELRIAVWPDRFVNFDTAINKLVSQIRAALGDRGRKARFIETLSKRGYRFTGQVSYPSSEKAHSASAYQLYVKGRHYWRKRTVSDVYRSIEEFKRSLEQDPDLALGYAGLADAYALLGIWGIGPSTSMFRASRLAAERALELDAGLAEAHTCLAEVLKDYDWDWEGAESRFRRAIALNGNYSTARQWYAQLLSALGRHSEAIREIELARRTDPFSPAINAYVPYIYLAARDYRRAAEEGRRAVEMDSSSPIARWHLGRAYLFSGDLERSLPELEIACRLASGRPMWVAELSFAWARAGDKQRAEALLQKLVAASREIYVSPFDFAVCCAGLGYEGQAVCQLRESFRTRVMRTMSIGDPEFDCLRENREFRDLREQLRLPGSYAEPRSGSA